MIFDSKLMFTTRTAGEDVPYVFTADGTTHLLPDSINLKGAHKNMGKTMHVGVRVTGVPTTVTGGITGQFKATCSSTVGGTYTPCGESNIYESALFLPGFEIKFPLTEDVLQFVKLSLVGVGTLDDGDCLAGIIS